MEREEEGCIRKVASKWSHITIRVPVKVHQRGLQRGDHLTCTRKGRAINPATQTKRGYRDSSSGQSAGQRSSVVCGKGDNRCSQTKLLDLKCEERNDPLNPPLR